MRPFLLITTIALLLVSYGCLKTNKSALPASNGNNIAQPTPTVSAEGGAAEQAEVKYFAGSIGDSLDLQMKLSRTGDQLTGSYYYQRIGSRIDLRGTIDKEGGITLEEFDNAGKQTGVFKGIWKADTDGLAAIAGNWSKPPGDKGADKKTAFSVHEVPIRLSSEADVVSKQIKESNKKLVYEISVQYPQVTGASNPNFEKFNQAVRGAVSKLVGDFKKEMVPEPNEEPRPQNSMGSDLSVNYEIALIQDDLASILFEVSSYYQGAAHPNSNSQVINYDIKNGKQLKLADLFKPGMKYLSTLSSYSITELKKQSKEKGSDNMLEDEDWIKKGAGPQAVNYRSWTITRKGLGITFDPYQVGPYVAGQQYVLVPYGAIKDLINPDGPIGQFGK